MNRNFGPRPIKCVTPKLEMGRGPDKFSFWKEKWTVYKRFAKLLQVT